MSALGIVVSPGYMPSAAELAELRPAFLRSILYSLDDLEPLMATGLPLLVTANNEMQEVAGWSAWDAAIEAIAERGQGQVFGACCGNEFDLYNNRNPSDVPPEFAADLVKRASAILRPRGIKTIATSVAGPDWQGYLERMAALCRDEADYFDFHGYGQRPDDWGSPGWMWGDLRPSLIRARELCGKPVIMSEYGVKVGDAGGEDQVAAFLTAAASTIAALGPEVCPHVAWFAWHDGVGAPSERGASAFGLVADDGRRRPAWHAFAALATVADVITPEPDPVPPLPEPEPVPMHTPDEEAPVDPWQYFDLERIVSASGCPADAVADAWPRIVAQLVLCGINDRATQIAAIGTVAIESASQFAPVREAFWLDEDWRRANLRYYPWYGRGEIQLTWRENYAAFGRKVDELWGAGGAVDLIARPDDALDPDISAAVLAVYFRDHGGDGLCLIPQAARRGDWREVRRLVQGADAGLDRLEAIAAALDAAPAPAEPFPLDPVPMPPADPSPAPADQLAGLVNAVAYLGDDIGDRVAALPTRTKRATKERDAIVAEMQRVRLESVGARP